MISTYRDAQRWARLGWRKGVVYPVCRRLYRDNSRDIRRTLLIAGTARSGTTWLAELLGARLPCRIMFEPFNRDKVEAIAHCHYFQYLRAEDDDPALLRFCEDVFTGRIRHPWVDRQVDRLFPEFRIVKEIRASFLLRWMRERFRELPILFIIRHPCAVVASRLQLGWATDGDIAPFLAQPALLQDFLADKLDLIGRCRTPAEKHAVVWCVSNLVPLRQFADGSLPIVFYEHLVRDPAAELPRLFRLTGLRYDESVLARVARPSATTIASSAILTGADKLARWKQELAPGDIDRVLRLVDDFGLGGLYGASTAPLG